MGGPAAAPAFDVLRHSPESHAVAVVVFGADPTQTVLVGAARSPVPGKRRRHRSLVGAVAENIQLYVGQRRQGFFAENGYLPGRRDFFSLHTAAFVDEQRERQASSL